MTAQSGGGGSTVLPLVQLSSQKITAASGTFAFPTISPVYSALRLQIVGQKSTAGAVFGSLILNSDNALHYVSEGVWCQAGVAGSAEVASGTSMRCLYLNGTDSGAYPSSSDLIFPGYAGTTFNKTMHGTIVGGGGAAPNVIAGTFGGVWISTAAITRIDLLDTFLQGSIAVLYGVT